MKLTKRVLTCILAVCLLLTVLPFAAMAADYTYDVAALQALPFATTRSVPNTKVATRLRYTFQADAITYMGLLLEDIAAGTYNVKMTLDTATKTEATVAVISKSAYDAIPGTTGMIPAADDNVVAKINENKMDAIATGTAAGSSVTLNVTFAGDAGNDYYLFFMSNGGTKWFLDICEMSLTKTGSVTPPPTEPAPTEPAPTEPATEPAPTEPATEPAPTEPNATEPQASKPASTQPNTNNDADNGGFPIGAIVAIVVVVIAGAAAAFIFLKKKKA